MITTVDKAKTNTANTEERIQVPPIDIYETDNEYLLKAEMPGVSRDNLEITLNNNELQINGKVDVDGKDDNLKYSEFLLYNYNRKFIVGDNINVNGITANLENGILTLVLPKSERVKPRKIEIKYDN